MSDCNAYMPSALPSDCNCTQKLPTVKLDPTTKAGAACALAGRPVLGDQYFEFEPASFSHSE